MVVADRRSSAAARLDDRRVFDDSNLPPDILLPGARHSQDVKCFELTSFAPFMSSSLINTLSWCPPNRQQANHPCQLYQNADARDGSRGDYPMFCSPDLLMTDHATRIGLIDAVKPHLLNLPFQQGGGSWGAVFLDELHADRSPTQSP